MSETELYFDEDEEPDPALNRITNAIIGACIEVHRILGPGFLESVYEEALAIEFELRSIPYVRQYPVAVSYKGTPVGQGRCDFIIDDLIIVEVKAIETIAPIHKAQAISYMKTTGRRITLIVNFNVRTLKDGIRRVAL
jgi:GxxExxY protein